MTHGGAPGARPCARRRRRAKRAKPDRVERVLFVFAPGGLRKVPLPATGSVVLGRAEDADVPLDDRSVSRQHARIHLEPLAIEDLGSANGTRVRRSQAAAETHEVVEEKLRAGEKVAFRLDEPLTLGNVTVLVRLRDDAAPSRREPLSDDAFVALAPETKKAFDLASRVAAGPLSVLVTGETGVGKEVLALHVHRSSPRKDGPFVEVNAATLTESLAESELFGHERGAFTGAAGQKKGYFEAASGGTLFLDEVGELSSAIQAKLLRVLETKKVTRVGGTQPIAVDVRVVAATHRDLAADVRAGAFRQDLYFRLNGITVTVPPLRERRADVPELARRFAARTAEAMGLARTPSFTEAALSKLSRHAFPGNVRELRNVVDRACALASGPVLDVEHVVFDDHGPTTSEAPSADGNLKDRLAAEEKRRILEALDACGGNQTKAAETLGMPRRTLVARLSEYGLTKPRKK